MSVVVGRECVCAFQNGTWAWCFSIYPHPIRNFVTFHRLGPGRAPCQQRLSRGLRAAVDAQRPFKGWRLARFARDVGVLGEKGLDGGR